MDVRLPAAFVAALYLFVSPAAAGQAAPAPAPVRVEIVAAPPAGKAGSPATLGVRFVMEDGWHIYWRNPGDSGGPPEVRWSLQPGLAAGPLQWPLPERIPFDVMVNYGYHGDVVLPVRVTAAGGWPKTPFVVSADVKWVACREICVPGKAQVSRQLPAGFAATSDIGAALVERALARVPAPASPGWKVSGEAGDDTFRITVETGRMERQASFFPLLPAQVEAAAPVGAAPTDRGVVLTIKKSSYLSAPIPSLKGVIVIGGRGYEVDVPLQPARSPRPSGRDGAHSTPNLPTRSPR